MKKSINYCFSTFAALLFLVSSTAVAQQSDYQIQQNFRAEYSELVNRIDNAVSTDDLSGLYNSIDELEAEYSGHSDIIDASLYPDTFSERVSDLRSRFGVTEENISVIEQLNERINSLTAELEDLRSQLESLDEENADLQEQIDRASSNERRLSALVRQYRQNLEQRDQFVTEFLENLVSKYEAMDSATQEEIASASENMQDDPIALIQTILSEYTSYADQSSGLTAPDYVRMRAQHSYFNDVWDRIGTRMAETYASDSPVQAEQEITDLLAAWVASINNKLWNALSTEFNQNGIELSSFASDADFNTALNRYVDAAVDTSLESNSEEDYEDFRNFSNYWNETVKANWGEMLTEGGVLSHSQIAAIDIKLNNWGEAAQPTSNLMFILFLVSLAVIIGLVVLLITRKG